MDFLAGYGRNAPDESFNLEVDRGESLTAGYIRRENKRLSPQNNIYEDVTGLIEKYVGASVAQNRNESRLMSKALEKTATKWSMFHHHRVSKTSDHLHCRKFAYRASSHASHNA
eukprot:985993_1